MERARLDLEQALDRVTERAEALVRGDRPAGTG